jgi:hypothetical protein
MCHVYIRLTRARIMTATDDALEEKEIIGRRRTEHLRAG